MDRARVAAVLVSVALVGATLSPLLRSNPYDDGFPLSTYPMFASKRPTMQTFHYALGITKEGQRRTLSPAIIGGTGEILQAMRVVERAVGRGAVGELCTAIAARVRGDAEFSDVVAIRIVTGTNDAVQYLAHDVVGREYERRRCEVKR